MVQPEQAHPFDYSLDLKMEISGAWDRILTTTSSITPKLLLHLFLLTHYC